PGKSSSVRGNIVRIREGDVVTIHMWFPLTGPYRCASLAESAAIRRCRSSHRHRRACRLSFWRPNHIDELDFSRRLIRAAIPAATGWRSPPSPKKKRRGGYDQETIGTVMTKLTIILWAILGAFVLLSTDATIAQPNSLDDIYTTRTVVTGTDERSRPLGFR